MDCLLTWYSSFYPSGFSLNLCSPFFFFSSLSRASMFMFVQGDLVVCDCGQMVGPCELYVLYLQPVYWSLTARAVTLNRSGTLF